MFEVKYNKSQKEFAGPQVRKGGENKYMDLNKKTFVGVDAHRNEHTAVAINRHEEEKGMLNFTNTKEGIDKFILWLTNSNFKKDNLLIGIEGGGNTRDYLITTLLKENHSVYEVNPLYTKQRRDYGTSSGKSDIVDAKLVAEVLTKKLKKLPRIIPESYSSRQQSLRKIVWFWEEIACQGARIKNQLKSLYKQKCLSGDALETKTLNLIINRKRQDLKRIEVLKKKLKVKMSELLKGNGDNLATIYGVGVVTAAKVVAYTKGIERFPKIDKFIQYAGIAPVDKSSGKSKRRVRNKKGNRNLNSALYMAALNQLRWNRKAKKYFDKKVNEGKSKKHAMRCLMKRVACIIYGMLKSGEDYRC